MSSRVVLPSTLCLIATIGLAAGCESLQAALQGMDKPTARVVDARLSNLSMSAATLEFDVEVANPYPVALPLVDLAYTLSSGGTRMLDGQTAAQGSVPANGSRTLSVPVEVGFAQVLDALSGVRPGQLVPYEASLELAADVPGGQRVSLPLRREGQLPIPAPPRVALDRVQWKQLNLSGAEAVLDLSVTNPNAFRLGPKEMGLKLQLGGYDIVDAAAEPASALEPGESTTLTVPIRFSPMRLGMAALNLLRGEGADYRLTGELSADTPYGPLRLPYTAEGRTRFTD